MQQNYNTYTHILSNPFEKCTKASLWVVLRKKWVFWRKGSLITIERKSVAVTRCGPAGSLFLVLVFYRILQLQNSSLITHLLYSLQIDTAGVRPLGHNTS